jgi:hypothetical protein
MRKLDSMWYHEMPASGKLASSHIAVVFCALVKNGMIASDLLSMEFDGVPNDFTNHRLSPMDYCIAFIDGEIFDVYIKAKYRKSIANLFDNNQIYEILLTLEGLEHDRKHDTYTLKCSWRNVDVLARWLNRQFA